MAALRKSGISMEAYQDQVNDVMGRCVIDLHSRSSRCQPKRAFAYIKVAHEYLTVHRPQYERQAWELVLITRFEVGKSNVALREILFLR